jgi:hypothetical protein
MLFDIAEVIKWRVRLKHTTCPEIIITMLVLKFHDLFLK